MKTVEIQLEDDFFDEITELYEALGLDISSAVKIFLHQSLHRQGIPFKVKLPKPEPQVIQPLPVESPIINDLHF